MVSESYHLLLTNRYVCERCMTHFFSPHDRCPACHEWGQVRRLTNSLFELADSEEELREMIARGQRLTDAGAL